MSEELKEARTVYVRVEKVHCPHFDASADGWGRGDVRDCVTTCDECKKQFKVATDADVRFV